MNSNIPVSSFYLSYVSRLLLFQTRRVTRATRTTVLRDKENATARAGRPATRAKPPTTAAPENVKPTGLARATASTAATRAKTVAVAASKVDPAAQGKRKREALGEVPKPPENRAAKPVNTGPGPSALKGKERVKELKEKFDGVVLKKAAAATTATSTVRRPLRTVVDATTTATNVAVRRTRASAAAEHLQQQRQQLQQVKEEPQPDDDAMAVDPEPVVQVVAPRRFVAARASAASVSGQSSAHAQPGSHRRSSARQPKREEEDEEASRICKKRRTSSDAPEDEAAEVENAVRLKEEQEVDPFRNQWTDLDAEDADDPLMVSEYVVEIFEYLKEVEVSVRVSFLPINRAHITHSKRQCLIHTTWKNRETLHGRCEGS